MRLVGRTGRAVVVAFAALLVLAGCASIPDDGPIHEASSDPEEPEESYVYDPGGPVAGSTPETIVIGFLQAMLARPITSEVAREFLTERADQNWDMGRKTIVYSETPTRERLGDGRIRLTFKTYATLDRRGSFTPANGETRSVDLQLKKVQGQWRIAELPDAFLVSQTIFEDRYRPVSVYYINDSRTAAVPDPVYLAGGDQLATNAMNSLLRGPQGGLGRVVSSFLPQGTSLEVSVRIRDEGLAEVRLSGPLDELDGDARRLMSAQVILTLQQVPGVTAVQIFANGVPYEVPGVGDPQPVDAWNTYDTSVSDTETPLFAERNDRLVVVSDGQIHPFAGPWDHKRVPIGDFGIDWRQNRIAVVNERRTKASVGSMAIDDTKRTVVLSGNNILSPTWDRYGWLWLTDTKTSSSAVWVWRDGEIRPMTVGPLEGMRIDSMAISPDGTRVAAVATDTKSKSPRDDETAAYIGIIRRESKSPAEVIDVHRVPLKSSGLDKMRSVAWRDAGNLVLLAERDSVAPQPYVVSLDGSSISGGLSVPQPSLPDIGARSVAASGRISDPVYVADKDGHLWRLNSNQRWTEVGANLWTPHYPG